MNDPASEPERQSASIADELAREVKRRRHTAGLTQRQLAAEVRYTRQYVGMAETQDAVLPSRELVAALDKVLGADGALVALRAQAHDEQRADRRRNRSITPQNIVNGSTVMLPVIVGGQVLSLPLLGETSVVASRLWSAIGDRSMALASCAFARRLADDIGDPVLGGIARIFESNLRSDAATLIGSDGDIVDGLRLLGEAAAVADVLPPSAQARVAAEQAQAFAVLELARECQEALTRAHRAVDQIAEPDQTGLFSD